MSGRTVFVSDFAAGGELLDHNDDRSWAFSTFGETRKLTLDQFVIEVIVLDGAILISDVQDRSGDVAEEHHETGS